MAVCLRRFKLAGKTENIQKLFYLFSEGENMLLRLFALS